MVKLKESPPTDVTRSAILREYAKLRNAMLDAEEAELVTPEEGLAARERYRERADVLLEAEKAGAP